MSSSNEVDSNKILKLLEPGGLLSRGIPGFEAREQQREMLLNVLNAYNSDAIALIEAGTGTGKSLAYLLPAIVWALKRGEKTVISTHTITLQEQLITKDIPMITKALNVQVKAALVKGMSNYLCLRKYEDMMQEIALLPPPEAEQLQAINVWREATSDGSKSDLPFVPSSTIWEQVSAEAEACNRNKCPHYEQCYFFKARKEAADAHLLVANHSLLFSDLAARADAGNYDSPCILPPYKRVVLDEAHHIEDIATEYFADKVSRISLMRLLARLSSDRVEQLGKLNVLKKRFSESFSKGMNNQLLSLSRRLATDLPTARQEIMTSISNTFLNFETFVQSFAMATSSSEESPIAEDKLRLLSQHLEHADWKFHVQEKVKQLQDTIAKYCASINSLDADMDALEDKRFVEQTRSLRFDIKSLAGRLHNAVLVLSDFVGSEQRPSRVRWIELQKLKTMVNIQAVNADLDVSDRLLKCLFEPIPTVVLCSATLTTNKQFDFFRHRLGLYDKKMEEREQLKDKIVTESVYDSPFNYSEQAMLVVPTDAPLPSHPQFQDSICENVWRAIQSSRGNAFVLFTSYTMMKGVYDKLLEKMHEHRYVPFRQGEENRRTLLDRFRQTDRAVLFGTDSFWEGVDVAGEALRCVIIVKLPFRVPSEPIMQARTEAIEAGGGSSFFDYAVPQAIVKFKQGFGRLIRNKSDRGCIVCLDPRLVTKRYGKMFLNSLPNCKTLFVEGNAMQKEMTQFYQKTYKLTKREDEKVWS